jgi:hypothetical protein
MLLAVVIVLAVLVVGLIVLAFFKMLGKDS